MRHYPRPRVKRGEIMHRDLGSEFEVFLVEDVILTLGNLRGSLSWLGTSQSADPAIFRAGLDRLDRQIGLLEDRARALTRQMVIAAATDPASDRTMPLGKAGHRRAGIGLDEGTAGSYDGTARYASAETASETSVDLEVEPDMLASFGLGRDTGHSPIPEPKILADSAGGDAISEPVDPRSIRRSPADPEPVSLSLVGPAQPMPDADADDLNIFGSDPDLLPDPSRSTSPVPFRSRRSAR